MPSGLVMAKTITAKSKICIHPLSVMTHPQFASLQERPAEFPAATK
jgi:hypothetical protein